MAKVNSEDFSKVPEWARGIVWYQIFPERFRNGDRSSDPRVENIRGSWPHDFTSPWQVHPWTSDWYELQPWEKAAGHDIWLSIERRRYGGDLAGIMEKLDYLQSLGVGGIYLNPVFESPSLHKYDGISYHHIDPNFGPDPDGDRKLVSGEIPHEPSTWVWTKADLLMRELIKEVHRRGMKIIFDGVFNHVSVVSLFFEDVIKRGPLSPYWNWFSVSDWRPLEDDEYVAVKIHSSERELASPGTDVSDCGENNKELFLLKPVVPPKNLRYRSWMGVRELPVWRQTRNGIVSGPRKYIFDITKRWMDPDGDGDPSDGVDGWRLDVAFCIRHPFWKKWRAHVRSINPEAFLVAEIVDDVEANVPYLQGDEFDAVMNYNFTFAIHEYFVAEKCRISTSRFASLLMKLKNAFRQEVSLAMQNLLDSHDTCRIASALVNRNTVSMRDWRTYYEKTRARNGEYDTGKPGEKENRILRLIVLFQMTWPGAPMIYYGDEAGMWGANDPCSRKPMVWDDLVYDDEKFLPTGELRPTPCSVKFNRSLFEYYRTLIDIRKKHIALRKGSCDIVLVDDARELLVFTRCCESDVILVIINNSRHEQPVRLDELNLKYGEYSQKRKLEFLVSSDDRWNNNVASGETDKRLIVVPPAAGAVFSICRG